VVETNGLGERWEEVVDAIRGSCKWCAAAVYAVHLCDLTILDSVTAPVLFGAGEDSAYEQLPLCLERPGTVLIQRELLVEHQNPGPELDGKVTGFACVLAHEMAHHALRHDWSAQERHRDVSELSVEDRRRVLDLLEAAKLAALTGIPYEVIVNHWGIADDVMRANLLEQAAERLDAQAIRANENARIEHDNLPAESGIHVAEEWGAAVVGCMMRYRLRKGHAYAAKMAESILAELPHNRGSLTQTVLLAACQNPDAESRACGLAIKTLETAFHNSDIQQCEEALRKNDTDWASLLSAKIGRR
jgi:hypothetical protein